MCYVRVVLMLIKDDFHTMRCFLKHLDVPACNARLFWETREVLVTALADATDILQVSHSCLIY